MSAQPIFRLKTSSYGDVSVTNEKLALGSVESDNINTGAISFDKLATSGRRYDAVVITSNTTLGSGDLNSVFLVNVAGGSRTITLPSTASGVTVGDWVQISNVLGDASTNNIIIDPGAGSSINNNTLGDRLRINVANSSATLVYSGSNNWQIVEKVF